MTKQPRFKYNLLHAVLLATLSSLTIQAQAEQTINDAPAIGSTTSYDQDTIVNFDKESNAYASVYADYSDINISSTDNYSLTLNSEKENGGFLRAKDGHTLSFSKLNNLTINTKNYVLNAVGGTISTDITGNLALHSDGSSGNLVQTAASDSDSSISLKAGQSITLQAEGSLKGIHNTGSISLTAGENILIDVGGDIAVYNSSGSNINLSAPGKIGISSSSTGIDTRAGQINISADDLEISGVAARAISATNDAIVNLGIDEDNRINTITLNADQTGLYSGSSDTTINIFAAKTHVSSSSASAINSKGNVNIRSTNLIVSSTEGIGVNLEGQSNGLYSDQIEITSGATGLVQSGGQLEIVGDQKESVSLLSVTTGSGYGIQSKGEGAILEIQAVETTITSEEQKNPEGSEQPFDGNSIAAASGATLIFKDTGNSNQKLTADSRWGAMFASNDSSIDVESGSVDLVGSVLANNLSVITLGSKSDLVSAHFSVEEGNTGSDLAAINARYGTININANKATVTSADYAILATASKYVNSSDSVVNMEVSDSLTINGDIASTIRRNDETVVEKEGTRIININQQQNGSVVIKGDVSTISDELTHSEVNIGLKTADSVLEGSVNDEFVGGELSDVTGGTNLKLENEASWQLTGDSNINSVSSDNGVIKTNGYQLAANTIANTEGGTTIETSSGKANQIRIREVEGEGLGIHLTDEATNELDANNPQEALAAIASIENADSGYSITSDEAGVLGDMQLVMDKDGNVVSFTEKANTVNEGLQDIAASNYLFFRSSMNDVNKRMGDLRAMPKTSGGAWARYYGGEMKYGDMNMETTYNTLQVGADGWIDNIYLGASVSISDGDGDLDNGSVDNRNYNFGVYGGWVSDNGQFVDVIVKRHRMETDGQLRSTAGAKNKFDFYNWGTSVSVEYGWRFNCPSTNFWVEPQAELMYGRLDSVNFRTSQGAQVSQDAVDSLIGRLGASVGYTFDQNRGSAYFKASVLHDWKGETDSDVTANGATRSFHDDLGGTWGEFALGGTYNITNTFSAYGDVMTTTGSPVRNPWQISVGVRYNF